MTNKIKINKNKLKNIAIIIVISLAVGFTLGNRYADNQARYISGQVQAQLTAIKK